MLRLTATGSYSAPILHDGNLALTVVSGLRVEGSDASLSGLAEANMDLDGRNVSFARVEYVRKLGSDLAVTNPKNDVFQVQLGYVHRFTGGPVVPVVGAAVDLGLVPAALEGVYGTRIPVGGFVFVGLQPPKLQHAGGI